MLELGTGVSLAVENLSTHSPPHPLSVADTERDPDCVTSLCEWSGWTLITLHMMAGGLNPWICPPLTLSSLDLLSLLISSAHFQPSPPPISAYEHWAPLCLPTRKCGWRPQPALTPNFQLHPFPTLDLNKKCDEPTTQDVCVAWFYWCSLSEMCSLAVGRIRNHQRVLETRWHCWPRGKGPQRVMQKQPEYLWGCDPVPLNESLDCGPGKEDRQTNRQRPREGGCRRQEAGTSHTGKQMAEDGSLNPFPEQVAWYGFKT